MKVYKGQLAYVNNRKLTTPVFDKPPADYWIDILPPGQWREMIEIDDSIIQQPVIVVDSTNSECKVLFINGQTGWIWKTNCVLQKKN